MVFWKIVCIFATSKTTQKNNYHDEKVSDDSCCNADGGRRCGQTLSMVVSAYDLASYNEATQCWETAVGRYTVKFAANVEDVRATAVYNQAKLQSVQCHDVMKRVREF